MTRDLMQLTERHAEAADRGRIAAHADRNTAFAGMDARPGGAADLRQRRLCPRGRSKGCGRRHRAELGTVRQRRARNNHADARRERDPMRAGCPRSLSASGEASTCSISAPTTGSAGIGTDATEAETMRSALARMVDAHRRTLDQLPTGVAMFDADQRLTFYNAAYRALWASRCRVSRSRTDRLHFDRGIARGRQAAGADGFRRFPRMEGGRCTRPIAPTRPTEHVWHLPDGRTLRVVTTPNPDGGVTYLFHDVSERLDLERRFAGIDPGARRNPRQPGRRRRGVRQRRALAAAQHGLCAHVEALARGARRPASYRKDHDAMPAAARRRRHLAIAASRW